MARRLGITSLYSGFVTHLRTAPVKKRIAPLQFTGKLEDYLVKEFVSYVYRASGNLRFAEVNLGKRGQQKIDIAILRRGKKEPDIVALIEAKYVRNRHRSSSHPWGAMDEVSTTFRDLKRQLEYPLGQVHASRDVKLTAHIPHLYGLVFASYTKMNGECDKKEDCYTDMLAKAAKHGLRYHDLSKPYWRSAYEDKTVKILGDAWSASLRVGLWRL